MNNSVKKDLGWVLSANFAEGLHNTAIVKKSQRRFILQGTQWEHRAGLC